jgi:anti-sigma-K factor RskA
LTAHDETRSLLGAYALDALSPHERRSVERHIEDCDDCAREARLLAESATDIALLAGEEELSAELVDRIVSSLPARLRSRARVRLLAAAAAAVLAAVAILGTTYIREASRRSELSRIVAGADRRVELQPVGDFPARGTLYLSDSRAALVLDDVPSAGRERSFQLWSLDRGTPSSMTVFDEDGRVVKVVDWRRGGDTFAVTLEPEGGSDLPTSLPVLRSVA